VKRNEIRTKIRYNIRESTADVWADAELNYWINDVQREVAAALNPMYNPELIQLKTQVLTSGTAFYDLPSDFLKIIGNGDVNSNPYILVPPDLARPMIIDEYSYDSSKKFFYIRDNDVYLYPTPGASEDGQGFFYSYLKNPTDFSDDTTTDGDLNNIAYQLVVDKVSGVALMKLESEESLALSRQFFDKYEKDLERLNRSMG